MKPDVIKILYVDDNRGDYILTEGLLSDIKYYHFQSDWISDYDAALIAIKNNDYDVCLIDCRIGQRSGLDLLAEMIENGVDLPIILVTGMDDREVDMKAMAAGAADFLIKGQFDANNLERSIRYSLEHCRVMAALKESEERFELAFLGANDGLWDWDLVTNKVHYSSRWKLILGYTDSEISDRPEEWFDRVHDDDVERLNSELSDHSKGVMACMESEFRMKRKDGSIIWVLCRGAAVKGDDDQPHRMAGSLTDISIQKYAEKALERFNRQMAEKNRELESVVYMTSHDLRSPLVSIQGFSQELSVACEKVHNTINSDNFPRHVIDELHSTLCIDIPEAIDYIQSSVNKMDSLLNGLLELSRLGRTMLKIRKIDMSSLVSEVVQSFQSRITKRQIHVQIDSLPDCLGDARHLNQLWSNLLDNALKFLDPKRQGQIVISGRKDDERHRIVYCLEDNGIGIAATQINKVFDLFHKVDSATCNGRGLGLPIAKRVLSRQNGEIWLRSELGKGSKFFISMPRTK